MRTAILFTLLPLALAVKVHPSHGPVSDAFAKRQATSNPPACATTCFAQVQSSPGNCDPSDIACLCTDPTVTANYAECIAGACAESDLTAAAQHAQQICSTATPGESINTLSGTVSMSMIDTTASGSMSQVTVTTAVSSFLSSLSSSLAASSSGAAASSSGAVASSSSAAVASSASASSSRSSASAASSSAAAASSSSKSGAIPTGVPGVGHGILGAALAIGAVAVGL